MNCFVKYWRPFTRLVVLLVCLSFFTISSYADVNDLMIGTGSNALMTLDLDDSDYMLMSPRSSIGSVTNTVDLTKVKVIAYCNRVSDNGYWGEYIINPDKNGRFSIGPVIDEVYIIQMGFDLTEALPRPGKYIFSLDFASDFSIDYSNYNIVTLKDYANTNSDRAYLKMPFQLSSGDIYLPEQTLELFSLSEFIPYFAIPGTNQKNIAGTLSVNFTRYDGDCSWTTAGGSTSSSDYEYEVSDSLSDLSSSVDTMTDEISGVTEAIQNLQGAMEPHYSNVLTQLHHITEQLHAFYDQVYNNIHLAQMALLGQIKEAIENIDLEVNVNLDKLKTSIDNMSTAIQNKLQSVQDAITGGYNNSGMNQDASELDQSLQEYEEAEQTVLDQVNDSLDDFEFDAGFDEYKTTISVFSDFLQDLYESSGGFQVVINLSLMLSIAGIVIGVYRFKDGG